MSKERKSLTAVCICTRIAYTRLVAEVPRQTGQTCPAWPDSWPWNERTIVFNGQTPAQALCPSCIYWEYMYMTQIWLFTHVYTTYGGREFLSQKRARLYLLARVCPCVWTGLGSLSARTHSDLLQQKQLALGLWLAHIALQKYTIFKMVI